MTPLAYVMLSFYLLPGLPLVVLDDVSSWIADSFSTATPAMIIGDFSIHEDLSSSWLLSSSELLLHSHSHSLDSSHQEPTK